MLTYPEYFVVALLSVINLTAFVVMIMDKRRSMRSGNIERIPEGILFFLATAGGALGIYTSMFLLRHKTRKWYFQIGIPLLVGQNVATLYLLWNILGTNVW